MTKGDKLVPQWVFDMLEAEGIDPARVPADSGVYILGSTVHVEVYDPGFRSTTTRTFPVGEYEPKPVARHPRFIVGESENENGNHLR